MCPDPDTGHTDLDLQVLLSGLGIAAGCRARSYKAICKVACSRLAFEQQAECANHRFAFVKDTSITCLALLAADRHRLRGDVTFDVLE